MVDTSGYHDVLSSAAPDRSRVSDANGSSNLLDEVFHVAKNSIIAPALNAAWIEPRNTVANVINVVTDEKFGKIGAEKEMAVDHAKTYSPEWFLQSISGGLGALVPYTIAGKATGGLMRAGGEQLCLTGTAAAMAKSEQLAFIGGAFAYDGARPLKDGETHLGNAFAGAAGFAVFGMGNRYLNFEQPFGKLASRVAVGAIGADTQRLVSTGYSEHRLPTAEELTQAAASGAAMNWALPTVQGRITKTVVDFQTGTNRGAAADRYLMTAHSVDLARSPELSKLVHGNPWARVKLGSDGPDFMAAENKIVLPKDRQRPEVIAKELTHLGDAVSGKFEQGFGDAAKQLAAGKVDDAYRTYRETRAAQETAAQHSSHTVANDLNGTRILDPKFLNMEISAWPTGRGISQEGRWRQEFTQFKESGGTWRPGTTLDTAESFNPNAKDQIDPKNLSKEERLKLHEQTVGTNLVEDLQKAGFIGVFAGGAVRDKAMGSLPKDYDIATSASPETVEKIFADKGYKVIATGKQFGVINVIAKGVQFEIATLRTDGQYTDGRRPDSVQFVSSLHEDAARRDLTMNSMFEDPLTSTTFDFFNGRGDIANKTIKAVGDPNQRFAEDPARMMRVPRFAARYAPDGFTVEPTTLDAITAHAEDINKVSGERIRDELKGVLKSNDPVAGLDIMMNTGLMKQPSVLPEVAATDGPKGLQDARWHPEGSTWAHTRMVMDGLAQVPYSFELRMGGLLHDIGKPNTQQVFENGNIGNYGHDILGAEMIQPIAKRLKFTNSERDQITELVRLHMQMHKVSEFQLPKLMDFLAHPQIKDMTALEHADSMGRGHTYQPAKSQQEFINQKIEELSNTEHPAQSLGAKPIVDGKLLKVLGVKSGQRLGEIKSDAFDAQRMGAFTDETTARQWLQDSFTEFRVKPFIDGTKLKELGVKPGPRMGEVKNATTQAQRDGVFHDEQGALEWLYKQYPELQLGH